MNPKPEDGLAAVIVAAEGALAAAIYWLGKQGPLPMHFGLNGHVDRWGDRSEAAAVAGAIAVGCGLLYALLPVLARPRGDGSSGGRAVPVARLIVLIVSLPTSLLIAAIGFGLLSGSAPLPLLTGILSVLMLAIGVVLGKVEPNPFVGVRTYWSLRSRLAWDKSNRLFGRIAFWAGAAGLIAFPLAPEPLALTLVTGAIGVGALAAIFESWRVWRDDPERQAA